MFLSLLASSVASTIVVDSIIAGTTLGTAIYCCGRNIKQPTASKRK